MTRREKNNKKKLQWLLGHMTSYITWFCDKELCSSCVSIQSYFFCRIKKSVWPFCVYESYYPKKRILDFYSSTTRRWNLRTPVFPHFLNLTNDKKFFQFSSGHSPHSTYTWTSLVNEYSGVLASLKCDFSSNLSIFVTRMAPQA